MRHVLILSLLLVLAPTWTSLNGAVKGTPKFLTEDHLKCSPCEPVYAPFDVTVDGLKKMLKKSGAKNIKQTKTFVTDKPMALITCDDGYNTYEFQFDVTGKIMSIEIEQTFGSDQAGTAQYERMCTMASAKYSKSYSQHGRLHNYTQDCHNMTSKLRIQLQGGTKILQTFTYIRM